MSDKSQPAARRREGTIDASLCFIMHKPQSNMTYLLASSLHWLPGGDNRWPLTLHQLSSFRQVTAHPTAISRHSASEIVSPVQGHTRHPHLHIHWRA